MTGTQKTLALGLREIASAVEAGKYGTDDEVDLETAFDDIEELITKA